MNRENKIYQDALADLQKRYGKESLDFVKSDKIDVNVIPTGSYKLNKALGVGGFPRGRIVEIYGNESSGKTTLALQTIRECQKNNGTAVYIDAEQALDLTYAKKLGINLSKLLVVNPEYGEQAFSIIEALVKTNMIDLIIVDSVAALVPKSELETSIEEQNIGLLPRLMSKGLRRLQAIMRHSNTCLIFINQLREKVGVFYGNSETTPGGRALKFYSSIRLEIKRSEIIKNDLNHIGIKSKITVIKNKVSPPLETIFIEFYFDKGVDYSSEIIDIAIQCGFINKSGSWYSYNDKKLCQGRYALNKILKDDVKLFKEIEDKILNRKFSTVN